MNNSLKKLKDTFQTNMANDVIISIRFRTDGNSTSKLGIDNKLFDNVVEYTWRENG